jgi:hypothetical protein
MADDLPSGVQGTDTRANHPLLSGICAIFA